MSGWSCRKSDKRVAALLVSLCFISAAGVLAQPYGDSGATAQSVGTNDGPHVYWADDTSAVVFYYCNDSVVSRDFTGRDSIVFTGFCTDTERRYVISTHLGAPGPCDWSDVRRIFAVSDLHGDYGSFAGILITAGIVDSALTWKWGDGHLVINGDVFDRGEAVTECLWLIYGLEREAARAGGAVHYLLGNHELMVLRGDLRYVNDRYLDGIARRNRFAYDDLFGSDMALGRWLRTKHAAVKINSTLFVHGGIHLDYVRNKVSIDDMNRLIRSGLDFSAAALHFAPEARNAYGGLGPLWYRGYTRDLEDSYPAMTTPQIDSVLSFYDAVRVVVGHSEQDSLITYHDGKVIAIDVDVEARGGQEGLLIEDTAMFRICTNGSRYPITAAQQ